MYIYLVVVLYVKIVDIVNVVSYYRHPYTMGNDMMIRGRGFYKNTETHKFCPICKTNKPRKEFNKNKSKYDGLCSECRPCSKERNKVYNYGRYFDENIDYTLFTQKKDNVCSICGKSTVKSLAIDHDHNTGKIRGLLCFSCNVGLGHFKDDITLLEKAIEYIKNNK